MTLGALGYVGYAVETTEGTLVAPTIFLPVSSFNFDDTNDLIVPDQIRRARVRQVAMVSPYSVSGTMDMELTPDLVSALLKSAWAAGGSGTVSSVYETTANQHVMTPGDVSPTFTFEASAADILIRRYGGIRVNTLDISGAFGEIVTASFGLEGTTRGSTGTPASPTFTTTPPFHFTGASIRKAGTDWGNVKSFSFTTGQNLDRVGTLRKTRNWRRTVFGMFDVGLSAAVDFQNADEYNEFLNESEFAVEIHLEAGFVSGTSGPRNTLVINIPRVRWNSVGVPMSATDIYEQSLEATILKPASGAIFTATLINGETSVLGG